VQAGELPRKNEEGSMNQDIERRLKRLEEVLLASAPHVAPLQAQPNWNAEMERQRTATQQALVRIAELEQQVVSERARADRAERVPGLERAVDEMRERLKQADEADDVSRLSALVESMYANIGRALPLETLNRLFVAVEGLRGAWNQLGRCVDEFEPEDMTACAEYRGFLDDAILAVLAVVPDDSHDKPTITPMWDEARCRVCGWPLAESADRGCVPGNCSMRPKPAQRADTGYAPDLAHARAALGEETT
jgi:hypothetical protein